MADPVLPPAHIFIKCFRAQQQLLDSTMTSTTSKSSIKPPPVIVEEVVDDKAEESNLAAAPSEQITETNGVNGSTEGKYLKMKNT